MRHCPTLRSDDLPLIAHLIAESVCQDRQRAFYHKCHRCVFRGMPVDFVPEAGSRLRTPGRNGVLREREAEPVAAVATTQPAEGVEDSGPGSKKRS